MDCIDKNFPTIDNCSPPYELRPYQTDLIESVLKSWTKDKRVIVQLPTGGGKSAIIGYLVKEIAKRGEPVLVVAHKIELIKQLCQHVTDWTGLTPGIIANKRRYFPNPGATIQVASIQALVRKKEEELPPAGLVVIDEAHHAASKSYTRLFQHYRDAYFLGATATPLRTDGRGLRHLHSGIAGYERLICGPNTRELIDAGYLSDFRLFSGETVLDPEKAGVRVRKGDYVAAELEEYARKVLLTGEIVETWKRHALGKRTVLYPVSVELSIEYCARFNSQGIPAAHIDADTPASLREAILERLRKGEILVLCQHSIVIEGVDIPQIECVQFARPTKSLTIWFQAIGRALRRAPGKERAIIIDHTTTHLKQPWIDEPLEWSLDPISLSPKQSHAVKCKSCHHVFRPTLHERSQRLAVCPNCLEGVTLAPARGTSFTMPPLEVEVKQGDFAEIERKTDPEVMAEIDRLFEEQEQNDYNPGWVGFQALEIEGIGYFELLEVAKRLGYKPGWAHYKWQNLLKQRSRPKPKPLEFIPFDLIYTEKGKLDLFDSIFNDD